MADPLEHATMGRGPEWIAGHVVDPEMIAPGLREPPVAASTSAKSPRSSPTSGGCRASRIRGSRRRLKLPRPCSRGYCIGCHVIDGDGGKDGPDLSRYRPETRSATLRRWIADPESVNPDAEMPAFGKRLTPDRARRDRGLPGGSALKLALKSRARSL